jgi:hypothetical protein
MSRDSVATVTSLRHGHALRLDRIAPCWHAATIWHTLVEVPPAATFESIRPAELGLLPTRALLRLRALPDRTLQRVAGMTPPRGPTSIADALDAGEPWTLLAERSDSEIVAGAIGAVWRPVIQWVGFEPSEFATFCEPGFAKVAAGFSVRHYGADRSLLSVEVRAVATSVGARDALSRYWQLSRPLIRMVVRGAARSIKSYAEQRGPLALQPM